MLIWRSALALVPGPSCWLDYKARQRTRAISNLRMWLVWWGCTYAQTMLITRCQRQPCPCSSFCTRYCSDGRRVRIIPAIHISRNAKYADANLLADSTSVVVQAPASIIVDWICVPNSSQASPYLICRQCEHILFRGITSWPALVFYLFVHRLTITSLRILYHT